MVSRTLADLLCKRCLDLVFGGSRRSSQPLYSVSSLSGTRSLSIVAPTAAHCNSDVCGMFFGTPLVVDWWAGVATNSDDGLLCPALQKIGENREKNIVYKRSSYMLVVANSREYKSCWLFCMEIKFHTERDFVVTHPIAKGIPSRHHQNEAQCLQSFQHALEQA